MHEKPPNTPVRPEPVEGFRQAQPERGLGSERAVGEILCSVQDGLALVQITNPVKLNAMSRHMWQQLRSVFEGIQANPSVCCVLITGAPCGKHQAFSAGGDISEYPNFRFNEDSLREFHEVDVWGGLQAMLNCDVPIAAQIDGACMGAGLEIASCCDMRMASSTAKFGAPIAKLGFPMAPKEAHLVANAVGELTAKEMLLEAAVLDAATMQSRGFLNCVVDATELAESAMQTVNRILELAPQAARLNKQTFRQIYMTNKPVSGVYIANTTINNIANDSTNENKTAYDYANSEEHREGIQAFIDKRKPNWNTD